MSHRKSEGSKEDVLVEPVEPGAPPEAQLGRVKKDTELAEIVEENSVHS